MNQGKRYLRNTVFTLYGAAALFIGLNRLYASTLDTQTPQWLRGTLTLGLNSHQKSEPPAAITPADLGALRGFTRLNVTGVFDVEIVGAPQYKVTLTSPPGDTLQLHATQKDELLWLSAEGNGGAGHKAILRIETPALKSLHVQDASQLTVHGLQAEEMTVGLHNVAVVRLQQNQVAHWKMYSDEPVEAQMDRTTLSAGSVQTQGNLSIRYGDSTP